MKELFILVAHLLMTLVRLARPGGVRSVLAQSLALKHQLLVLQRRRKRAPRLTPWDRLFFGLCSHWLSPQRQTKTSIVLRPSTFTRFHQALVRCKYRLLYTSRRRCRPGPKGPSAELIAAVVEMKRRNPRFGYLKIAQQISHAFGVELNKDVVRRILQQYGGGSPPGNGPSWLTALAHAKDSLWSLDLFRCESILLQSCWVMVIIDVFSRRFVGFAVQRGEVDGPAVCRMFNYAREKQGLPKHLSTDHDPLFRFHRWLANLAHSRDRGGQVSAVRASFASVRRTDDPHDSGGTARPGAVLESARPRTEALCVPDLLQPLPCPQRNRRHSARARA